MTDLIHNASDDQIALTVCFGAVLVSGLVMYFSYYVGAVARNVRSGTIRLPASRSRDIADRQVGATIRDKAA